MTRKQMIKLFGEKNIRTVWDDKEEKWYFSIVDVVEVLTDSADPKQYIKKMRKRDPQLDANWGTICTLVQKSCQMTAHRNSCYSSSSRHSSIIVVTQACVTQHCVTQTCVTRFFFVSLHRQPTKMKRDGKEKFCLRCARQRI